MVVRKVRVRDGGERVGNFGRGDLEGIKRSTSEEMRMTGKEGDEINPYSVLDYHYLGDPSYERGRCGTGNGLGPQTCPVDKHGGCPTVPG